MNEVLRAAVIGSSSSGGWGHNIDELFIGVPGLHTVAVADDTDDGVGECAFASSTHSDSKWIPQLAKNAR